MEDASFNIAAYFAEEMFVGTFPNTNHHVEKGTPFRRAHQQLIVKESN
jgi:hypothetical protein